MNDISKNEIAPCGMICSLCLAFQRDKNTCAGCRSKGKIFGYCEKCIIRNCSNINEENQFCYSCKSYPCKRLKALDYRYRTKYDMSFIENLNYIKLHGTDDFENKQNVIWKCPSCGGLKCIHRKCCLKCDSKK